MNTSDKGIDLIKKFEGCRLEAYKCPAGIWTIGYGHTGGVTPGMRITQAEAEVYLRNDLHKFEQAVTKTGLKLNQNQFDALVSFTYNCGSGCLQTLIKNRNLTQIADALTLYNRANNKILDGLTKRRKMEREMFLDGMFVGTKYKVIASALNVRNGAGTNFGITTTVPKGTILTILEEKNGFGRLANGNYVSMQYLERS